MYLELSHFFTNNQQEKLFSHFKITHYRHYF